MRTLKSQRLFRGVFRVSGWLRNHLTRAGIALALLTAFAGAIGLNTEVNLAHQVFSLGTCLLAADAASAVWRRRRLPPLSARRELPAQMNFGAIAEYSIVLQNDGKVGAPALQLQELLAQPWGDSQGLLQPAARNYAAYLRALRRLRILDVALAQAAELPAGKTLRVRLQARPAARGQALFEGLHVVLAGVLGLAQSRKPVPVEAATQLVFPRQLAVDFVRPDGSRVLHTGGIAMANHVGDSEEFRSLREYRPGDPLRSVHWRSFARTGRPMVREYQQEYFSRHALVLDTACAAGYSEAFEASVSVAAWIACRPIHADALLDLMFVGDRVHRLSTGRSLGSADRFLRVLATVTPTAPDSMAALMRTLAADARQVSSAIVILQAWDAERRAAMSELMAGGLRPTILLLGQPAPQLSDDPQEEARWRGLLHFLPLPAAHQAAPQADFPGARA